MPNSMRRMAVVTGGSGQVGREISLALAALNNDLLLIGRKTGMLHDVARQARMLGADARYLAADLGDDDDLNSLTEQLSADVRKVDVLVHAAGFIELGRIEQMSLEAFDRHYRVNVKAPYAVTQSLLSGLKAVKGDVVFINSSSGIWGKPLQASYSCAKHALHALADSLRAEVNVDGVRVLSVFLGRTATERQAEIHAAEGKPYRPEALLQPKAVASVVAHAVCLPKGAEVTDIHIRSSTKY